MSRKMIASIVALLFVASAAGDTIHVCWDGSGDYVTIQEGINAAVDGDEVIVCEGLYVGNGNRDLDCGGRAITVRSTNPYDPEVVANTVVDCQGSWTDNHRAFRFHSGESAISVVAGLTMVGGFAPLEDVGTMRPVGGAIFADGSSPTVTNCVITGNQANGEGGGIYCYNQSNLLIDRCTIVGNSAGYKGAGAFCDASHPMFVDCTITGNFTQNEGAGLYFWSSSPTVYNCAVVDNSAGYGGGIRTSYGSPLIVDCVIARNTASYYGGGMYFYHGTPVVSGCTIAYNSAGTSAGGMICSSSSVSISNSILWADSPQEIYLTGGGPSAEVAYSDVQGSWAGAGNIDSDPLFVDPDNGEYHLSPGSPCIDAGCNGVVPPDAADLDDDGDTGEYIPLDLDGEGRFFDDPDTSDTGCGFSDIVDMGAYEFGDTGPQPCPGDMDGDRVVDQSDLGILLSRWGASEECDLNCDGVIDQADLGILLAHWGEGCP